MVKKTTVTTKKATSTKAGAKRPASKSTAAARTAKSSKASPAKSSRTSTAKKTKPVKRTTRSTAASSQKVDYYPNRVALLTATAAVLILLCLGLIVTQ